MEQKIGRKLLRHEHVHHINGDKLDNQIDNLKIISMIEHGSISGKQAIGKKKPLHVGQNSRKYPKTFICQRCHKEFFNKWSRPFRKYCSRLCQC